MVSVATRSRNLFMASTIALALLLSLPFLFVLAFVLRPVLLAGALAALVACLVPSLWGASATSSPAVSRRAPVAGDRLGVPPDVMLHRRHVWVRAGRDDEFTVGIDDLAQSVLGPVRKVETVPVGRHVDRGQPLLWLWCNRGCLCFRAPLSGIVLGTNTDVLDFPHLINDEPYDAGWVVRLRADDARGDRRDLMRGPGARIWFDEEVARVSALVGGSAASTTSERQRLRRIDDADWNRITTTFAPAVSDRVGNEGSRPHDGRVWA